MDSQKYRTVAGTFLMDVENPLSGKDLKEFVEKQHEKIGDILQKLNLWKKK